MKTKLFILCMVMLGLSFSSCKKAKADPHIPPDVILKTGGNYIDGNFVTVKQDTVYVGIIATKTEDNLKSYNASYAYDGASTTTTFYNYLLTEAEYEHYDKDLMIVTRNQAGTEKWVFSIIDRDGNITQKTINITVQ